MKKEVREEIVGILERYRTNEMKYDLLDAELKTLMLKIEDAKKRQLILADELETIRYDEKIMMEDFKRDSSFDEVKFKDELSNLINSGT